MTRAPSICGVILATGAPMRDGREKALLPWPPAPGRMTLLGATIEVLKRHTDLVIVVAGKNAQLLEPVVYTQAGFIVVNSAPELGELNSLRLGLREVLNYGRDAAFITSVERPPSSDATVARVHSAFLEAITDRGWAAVPEFEGQLGSPFVIGREMIEKFLRAPLTNAATDVLRAHLDHIEKVEVADALVCAHFETEEEYLRLASLATSSQETIR